MKILKVAVGNSEEAFVEAGFTDGLNIISSDDNNKGKTIVRSLERQEAKTIPIFAMTANAFLEDKKQSKEAGMNEHLSKPLDEKKLMNTIWKYTIGKNSNSKGLLVEVYSFLGK